MNILKNILIFILLFNGFELFSQEQNNEDASVYIEFQRFFEKEIKHQGVKGNWIFGLKEISAYHKFDYTNNGLLDILIEFNAEPIDEGSYTNYYAVLFQNINNRNFEYVNYLDTNYLNFVEYFNGEFVFQKNNNSEKVKFNLTGAKFIKLK